MEFVIRGHSPWDEEVLLHVSWTALYVALAAAVLFMLAHALYVSLRATPASVAPNAAPAGVPERIPRHSLAARLFHWIMAASVLTLLVTGFLPIVGVRFRWVTIHWFAGLVLAASILYHVVHASVWMDVWSIWLTREDVENGLRRLRRALGMPVPALPLPGKYPTDNKLFHTLIVFAGATAVFTGLLMLKHVRTPFLTRDPYLLGDRSWGIVYTLHGAAGIAVAGLTIAHVYFAMRPEKLSTTRSMVVGWIPRTKYLEQHDPHRWIAAQSANADGRP